MSIDRCAICEKMVDTDYNPEGYYYEAENGVCSALECYICLDCQEERPDIVEQYKEKEHGR